MRVPHFDRFVKRASNEVVHPLMRPVYTINLRRMRLYSRSRKRTFLRSRLVNNSRGDKPQKMI